MECELFDVWYKWNCDCIVWIEVELENEHLNHGSNWYQLTLLENHFEN